MSAYMSKCSYITLTTVFRNLAGGPFGHGSGQGAKEGLQCLFFGRNQVERPQFHVAMRVGDPAAIVEVDDFGKGRDAAVVHVRGGAGHLPKRGRLEGATIL